MRDFSITYLDASGASQKIEFSGEIEVSIKLYTFEGETSPRYVFLLTEMYNQYDLVKNTGLYYVCDNLPSDGSNYRFNVIINDTEYNIYNFTSISSVTPRLGITDGSNPYDAGVCALELQVV